MLVGGVAPDVGGTSSGVMSMRRSRCGGDLVRCVSQWGTTPLISASYKGRLAVVKALLAAGAHKEAKNRVSA